MNNWQRLTRYKHKIRTVKDKYAPGTIRRLEKWKYLMPAVDALANNIEYTEEHEEAESKLKEAGFRKEGWKNVWINDKQRVVIKNTGSIVGSVEEWEPYLVPMIMDGRTQLQPLVQTRSIDKARSILGLVENELSGGDVHYGNVGYYKRVPVLFDW
jgi:hypothetical protein